MEHEIFVDTSGFYALLVRADEQHSAASNFLQQARSARRRFVTTDYVLDETASLLKARRHGHLSRVLFETVMVSSACIVDWTDSDRFQATTILFQKHLDKAWSFTDCSSFVLMKARRIQSALTKDAHFREAGFDPLLV